jgi:hypothetical protein
LDRQIMPIRQVRTGRSEAQGRSAPPCGHTSDLRWNVTTDPWRGNAIRPRPRPRTAPAPVSMTRPVQRREDAKRPTGGAAQVRSAPGSGGPPFAFADSDGDLHR